MSVELLQTLSLVGYIVSAVLLVLTVVLFFVLKVPQLIGYLSGATARKAIEDIRQQSEKNASAYAPSKNAARGKLTDKISPSGRLLHNTGTLGMTVVTEKIGTQNLQPLSGNETTVFSNEGGAETTLLSNVSGPETTVLNADMMQTENGQTELLQQRVLPTLKIEVDIGFWESNEIIE